MALKTGEAVAQAWTAGDTRRAGNCRTDGRFYYLFDKKILSNGPPDEAHGVTARLLSRPYTLVYMTFAGWATPTTVAHLNAAWPFTGRFSIPKGVPTFTLNGVSAPLEVSRWYTFTELKQLLELETT